MKKLHVKVVATISNAWVSTTYEWFYCDFFTAQQSLDSLRGIYGDRLKVLSITELD